MNDTTTTTTSLLDAMRQTLITVQNEEDNDTATASEYRGALLPGNRREYVLAGNANGKASFTILNPKTQVRFTYRARPSDDGKVFFIDLLRGPNNYDDYSYIGIINARGEFRWTAKSKVAREALSFRAFEFFSKHFEDERLDVWQEGRCGRCGRKLTVPESIDRGLGPDCATKGRLL